MSNSASEAVIQSLLRCRKEISDRVHEVSTLTQREIMQIAALVEDIVNNARAHVAENEIFLSTLSADSGVSQAISQQSEGVERFCSWVSDQSKQQQQTTALAQRQCEDILQAGERIERLAQNARMLNVNILIQAAHLGEHGNSVKVIANDLRHFSQMVEEANTHIAEVTTCLLDILPQLSTQAHTLQQGARTFRKELAGHSHEIAQGSARLRQQTQHASAHGQARLTHIVDGSLEVLSHLQFQDPMTQHLQQLEPVIGMLLEDASESLGVELAPEQRRAHRYAANLSTLAPQEESVLAGGELLLF